MIFQPCALNELELAVVDRIGELKIRLQFAVGSQPKRWGGLLRRNVLARNIQGSNSIEGYNVSGDDAVAAVEGEEPFEAEGQTWDAVTGYRRAMSYVLQLAGDPHFSYSADLLRSLHYMMIEYEPTKNPGRWRPGPVYVWAGDSGEMVYESPDAELVHGLIEELVTTLQTPDEDIPAVVRAAMAHLNLVMIHPFSDGNGRMARCLQTLVLARTGTLSPTFSSIEEYLGRNTPAYYKVLGEVGRGKWSPRNDTRPWVRFCLTAHFRQATTLLRRGAEIGKLWNIIEAEVTSRGLPERLILAVVDAALGYKVRNATYRKHADVTPQLASRDLKSAVDSGLLIPHGSKRGSFYSASQPILTIRDKTRLSKSVPDPFTTIEPDEPVLPGLEQAV